jgi:hypothetical protein
MRVQVGPRLSLIVYLTMLLAVDIYVHNVEPAILSTLAFILIPLSYVVVIMRPQYSWQLFFINIALMVLELLFSSKPIPNPLITSLMVIFSIMVYLSLNGIINIRILVLSLAMLIVSVILTYTLFGALRRFLTVYMTILNINTDYFALALASSVSALILFLIDILLGKLLRRLMHH